MKKEGLKTGAGIRPQRTTEAPFQTLLLLALSRIQGVRAWRQNCGTVQVAGTERRFRAGPPKGAADISGVVGPEGWRLEIECKAEGRKRRPEQEAWAETMAARGAVYYLADARHGVEVALLDVAALIAARVGRGVIVGPAPAKRRTRKAVA